MYGGYREDWLADEDGVLQRTTPAFHSIRSRNPGQEGMKVDVDAVAGNIVNFETRISRRDPKVNAVVHLA